MLASIKQVCPRWLISVSHSVARLPVWSPYNGATMQLSADVHFLPSSFFLFFSLLFAFCFSLLLPGADMSSFLLGLRASEMYSRVQKTDRIWLENSSITDALAMSADITFQRSTEPSEIHRTNNTCQQYLDFTYNIQQQILLAAFGIGQLLCSYTMAKYEPKLHWSTTPQPSISFCSSHLSYSEPLHYDSAQPIQTSALQISQTQTP